MARDMSAGGSTLAVMPIEPPTDEDRSRLADDLRERAALVLEHGWADYEGVWSTGQVLGVRAVLNEPGAEDVACPLWAPTLWGVTEAEADAARDYAATRWWFSVVARPLPEELSETESAQGRALRAATAEWGAAMRSGDEEERRAAGEQFFQLMGQYDPGTRDKIHAPDDAGEYRDALVRVMRRIPDGWGRWISCDAGWYQLICQLDEQLAAIDPAYSVHQVKEKFGTLRYYYATSDGLGDDARAQMRELVDAAEHATETVCEKCGGAGELHRTRSGRMKTLCGPCALLLDRGYRPAHERVEELTPDLPGIWKVTDADGGYTIWDLRMSELSWNTGEDRGRIVSVLSWPHVGERSVVVVEREGVEVEVPSGEISEIRRMR